MHIALSAHLPAGSLPWATNTAWFLACLQASATCTGATCSTAALSPQPSVTADLDDRTTAATPAAAAAEASQHLPQSLQAHAQAGCPPEATPRSGRNPPDGEGPSHEAAEAALSGEEGALPGADPDGARAGAAGAAPGGAACLTRDSRTPAPPPATPPGQPQAGAGQSPGSPPPPTLVGAAAAKASAAAAVPGADDAAAGAAMGGKRKSLQAAATVSPAAAAADSPPAPRCSGGKRRKSGTPAASPAAGRQRSSRSRHSLATSPAAALLPANAAEPGGDSFAVFRCPPPLLQAVGYGMRSAAFPRRQGQHAMSRDSLTECRWRRDLGGDMGACGCPVCGRWRGAGGSLGGVPAGHRGWPGGSAL